MFNWKIIVTVVIIFCIIAFFLSTQTSVQEFFKFAKEKIYAFFGKAVEEGYISFSLVAGYDNNIAAPFSKHLLEVIIPGMHFLFPISGIVGSGVKAVNAL